MTTFDGAVLFIIGLSMLLAFFRGVVRELIAVIAWVLGFIGAILLGWFAGQYGLPLAIQAGGIVVLATSGYLWLTRGTLEGV